MQAPWPRRNADNYQPAFAHGAYLHDGGPARSEGRRIWIDTLVPQLDVQLGEHRDDTPGSSEEVSVGLARSRRKRHEHVVDRGARDV